MIPPDGTDSSRLESCWIWGTSKRNVRIEALWRQLGDEVTRRWRDLFTLIGKRGLDREKVLTDRVIMLFAFMPILRLEIGEFLLDKNEYRIRQQPERGPYHVAGIPNRLYEEESIHGFPTHLPTLQDWEARVDRFGRIYTAIH